MVKLQKYESRFKLNNYSFIESKEISIFDRENFTTSFKVKEAVINVDKYKNILNNLLKQGIKKYQSKNFKYNFQILSLLNNDFKEYNIVFEDKGVFSEDAIEEMMTNKKTLQIVVLCNSSFVIKFKEADKDLLQTFNNLISHELVHRGQLVSFDLESLQYAELNQRENKIKLYNKYKKKGYTEDEISTLIYKDYYLANKREIMSYANQSVEEFRFLGYTNKQIKDKIKSFNCKESNILSYYLQIFSDYKTNSVAKNVINLFHKYMYMYLSNQGKNLKVVMR